MSPLKKSGFSTTSPPQLRKEFLGGKWKNLFIWQAECTQAQRKKGMTVNIWTFSLWRRLVYSEFSQVWSWVRCPRGSQRCSAALRTRAKLSSSREWTHSPGKNFFPQLTKRSYLQAKNLTAPLSAEKKKPERQHKRKASVFECRLQKEFPQLTRFPLT